MINIIPEEPEKIIIQEVDDKDTFKCCNCHNNLPSSKIAVKFSDTDFECFDCFNAILDLLSDNYDN